MSFLSWLGGLVLNFVWGKLTAFLTSLVAFLKRNKEIDDAAKESVKPLKNAQTGEEIDNATDDALGGV